MAIIRKREIELEAKGIIDRKYELLEDLINAQQHWERTTGKKSAITMEAKQQVSIYYAHHLQLIRDRYELERREQSAVEETAKKSKRSKANK